MGIMEFDFHKANAQIRELETLAVKTERLVSSEYAGTIQELSGSWKGAGADAYMRKAHKLQEKMEGTARELQQTASIFSAAVKQVRAAEHRAAAIAAGKAENGR